MRIVVPITLHGHIILQERGMTKIVVTRVRLSLSRHDGWVQMSDDWISCRKTKDLNDIRDGRPLLIIYITFGGLQLSRQI